jgi:hypothetical protein
MITYHLTSRLKKRDSFVALGGLIRVDDKRRKSIRQKQSRFAYSRKRSAGSIVITSAFAEES